MRFVLLFVVCSLASCALGLGRALPNAATRTRAGSCVVNTWGNCVATGGEVTTSGGGGVGFTASIYVGAVRARLGGDGLERGTAFDGDLRILLRRHHGMIGIGTGIAMDDFGSSSTTFVRVPLDVTWHLVLSHVIAVHVGGGPDLARLSQGDNVSSWTLGVHGDLGLDVPLAMPGLVVAPGLRVEAVTTGDVDVGVVHGRYTGLSGLARLLIIF